MGVPADALITAHQVHSPDAIIVRAPFPGERPKADAVVTDRPGIAVAASTADCGPVLFADPEARVIGAAHAGWKGAFTGVLENTIAAMESLGARRENIVAVLGPILGSFILSPLAEASRIYFGQGGWSGAHLVAYGLLLIAVVLFLPQGAYPALRRLWVKAAAR